MKFPWKWLLPKTNRLLNNGGEPATAVDREMVRKQLQREMELEREIIRQRGIHGGGGG